MKVKDYEVDFNSGLMTCCWNEILENNDDAYEGMILECEECGLEMKLEDIDGVLMWRAV